MYIEKKGTYVFAYLRFAYVVLGFSLAIIFIREYYLNRISPMFCLVTRTRVDTGRVWCIGTTKSLACT